MRAGFKAEAEGRRQRFNRLPSAVFFDDRNASTLRFRCWRLSRSAILTPSMGSERRHSQRMKLAKPLLGMIDGQNGLILDVGISGAFVEHHGTYKTGERARLTFRWHGSDIEYLCEVVHTTVVREGFGRTPPVSHSGLRFVESIGGSDELLQDMMATFVGRILAAQRANARGETDGSEGEAILSRLGEARRSRTAGFITYRLIDDEWRSKPTNSPHQPLDGFTVAAYEDRDELQVLCRAYETANDEGKRLIQLVAELSVLSVKKR